MKENYILMIDDDEDDRFIFSEAVKLVDSAITCRTASRGEEAFAMLRSQGTLPRVIFLDINMAEMSGWECLRQLKEDRTFRSVPVIMYSTSVHSREMNLASESGAYCYCVKPDNIEELVSIIRFVDENLEGNLKVALDNYSENHKNLEKYLRCFV